MTHLVDEIYLRGQGRYMVLLICQAAWQKGIIYGSWFDMFQPWRAIEEEVNYFLAKSPVTGKRLLIQDYQGFYSLRIKPEEELEEVHKKAFFVAEYGLLGVKLTHCCGENIESARQVLKYNYEGKYESELDYAIDWFKHRYLQEISLDLRECIDYSRLQEQLFLKHYFSLSVDGSAHIFSRPREGLPADLNMRGEDFPSKITGSGQKS